MEALAILFAFAVLIAVLVPEKPPPPKNNWLKLGEAVDDILRGTFNDSVLRPKPPKPKPEDKSLGWAIILSVLIGMLVLFGG